MTKDHPETILRLHIVCPHVENGGCAECLAPQLIRAMNDGIIMGARGVLNAIIDYDEGKSSVEKRNAIVSVLLGEDGGPFVAPRGAAEPENPAEGAAEIPMSSPLDISAPSIDDWEACDEHEAVYQRHGACPECVPVCSYCKGTRRNPQERHVRVRGVYEWHVDPCPACAKGGER